MAKPVNLPSYNMIDLSSSFCERLPEGTQNISTQKKRMLTNHTEIIHTLWVSEFEPCPICGYICGYIASGWGASLVTSKSHWRSGQQPHIITYSGYLWNIPYFNGQEILAMFNFLAIHHLCQIMGSVKEQWFMIFSIHRIPKKSEMTTWWFKNLSDIYYIVIWDHSEDAWNKKNNHQTLQKPPTGNWSFWVN